MLELIVIVVAYALVVTALLQYLWNTTMPQVFNLRQIAYWQAFRLIVIFTILTSGLLHINR